TEGNGNILDSFLGKVSVNITRKESFLREFGSHAKINFPEKWHPKNGKSRAQGDGKIGQLY
ncbi:MAG TPA: hypothetical protein PLD05_11890, partial [Thermogutta sp.]|nr:hypothetical protein [Thermogutta sp.]